MDNVSKGKLHGVSFQKGHCLSMILKKPIACDVMNSYKVSDGEPFGNWLYYE